MSFLGSLLSPITSLLGGGSKSKQVVNTTVETSTKQIFSPNNNIDNNIDVNIDIDKLADTLHKNSLAEMELKKSISKDGLSQTLSIANKNMALNSEIANKNMALNSEIANKSMALQYAIANENIKNDLTEQEQNKLNADNDLKIKVLTLDEQKQQNKRITWIALGGLVVTVSGFILSNSKRGGKK